MTKQISMNGFSAFGPSTGFLRFLPVFCAPLFGIIYTNGFLQRVFSVLRGFWWFPRSGVHQNGRLDLFIQDFDQQIWRYTKKKQRYRVKLTGCTRDKNKWRRTYWKRFDFQKPAKAIVPTLEDINFWRSWRYLGRRWNKNEERTSVKKKVSQPEVKKKWF